jgi:2-oxo-4-hydroxy-4-carboxy-5-ureidoimidazoline decarboxylase
MTTDVIALEEFGALPEPAAVELLLKCCSSPAWARAVAARRPFPTVEAVLGAADAALAELPERELDQALAGHPRIGTRSDDPSSQREQAGVVGASDDVRAALAAWNREYEATFGHVYLVRASGRSAGELLEILLTRLRNDPATERRIVRGELAQINRIRLRRLFGADPGESR